MNGNGALSNLDKIGSVLLFSAALLAIIISNSPLSNWYHTTLSTQALVSIGEFELKKPILLWINDGLMAIYFLLVGLEIKREIKRGILSDRTSIVVPAIAALSGLLFPTLIFYFFNNGSALFLKGWAIPTATDIAFTLGILALLGSRVPISLKILLTAIAIFDDIAAIVIIAIFYTNKLSVVSLFFAFFFSCTLISLNQFNCKKLSLYLFFGLCLWLSVLKSGVHATLAGIVIAMTIPDNKNDSLLSKLEQDLLPWSVFFILPLFAFANSGITFVNAGLEIIKHPIVLGTALGLFLGKQLGIFLPLFYFVKFKHYLCYENITLKQIYGIALLCGVGFTMSLFIGSLAYKGVNAHLLDKVKIGVVMGSLVAGLSGYLILRFSKPTVEK